MFLSFLVSLRDWREALISETKDEAESPMVEAFHAAAEEVPFAVSDERFFSLNGLSV